MDTKKYNFSGLRILVVDDNEFAHSILRDILFSMRVKDLRHVHDAKSAMREIQSALPDILIVDLLMKPIDGFELIKRIRDHEADDIRHLPILVISAYTTMTHIVRARDMGASEVLCKPISVASVYDRFVHMREYPRQFVRTQGYIGPDRRRTLRGFEGMDRRSEGKETEQEEEADGERI